MADVAFLLLGAFLGIASMVAVVVVVGALQRRRRSKPDVNVNEID
jgi:hypothetical protein